MTPEQEASVKATAAERAAFLVPTQKQITLDDLHRRVIALENHPALSVPALETEESNG